MDELRCKIVFEGNSVSVLGINCETSIVDGELRIKPRDETIPKVVREISENHHKIIMEAMPEPPKDFDDEYR